MFNRILTTLVVMFLSVGLFASNSHAVSEAAALFLRIAPGARAGGMGEAFVAVADDATATHWNPAGLGAYPLAQSWNDASVPKKYRPLKAIAALKKGKGKDYQAYEIWAISTAGLVRFDNRKWHAEESFTAPASQTVEKIVSSYFRENDKDRLSSIISKVAEANSSMTLEELKALRDTVMSYIPESYSAIDGLTEGFDSLLAVYNECRINWTKVDEIKKNLANGLKDSVLTETECDRINISVEKAKSRFLPEELLIPYASFFEGELTAIASNGKILIVGTTKGLYSYNGKRWSTKYLADDTPVGKVNTLLATPWLFYIGTDDGLYTMVTNKIKEAPAVESLPDGPVTAIGADYETNVWIVVNDDIYRYDGRSWSNYFYHTVSLDEDMGKIAEKFAIYGTESEISALESKIRRVNKTAWEKNGIQPVETSDSLKASDSVETDTNQIVNSNITVIGADTTYALEEKANIIVDLDALNPGDVIRIPFVSKIKGEVTCIYPVSDNSVWVGTENGALYFNGNAWKLPGYKPYTVTEGESLDSLIAKVHFRDSATAEWYRQVTMEINDLDNGLLQAGQEIKLPFNATAARVNLIRGRKKMVYIATTDGLRAFDGQRLFPVTEKGMDKASVIYIETIEDELWLASDKEIVAKANGHNELTLMHVNWLPELANDLYYEFLSYVTQIQGWGTVGANFTYITYGTIHLTDASQTDLGTDEPFEIAFALSYGTSLSRSLKGGISAKVIYSRLAGQEIAGATAGTAKGTGRTTGLAVDLGLLYMASPRLTFGMAITNLGPDLQYSQQSQADPLPRNLALGFSYKLLQSDYNRLLITAEINKLLVNIDSFRQELKEVIVNSGVEFVYANLLAIRAGYIYDQEGRIKTPSFGAGLTLMDRLKFDFSYIPNSSSVALANTLRMSLTVLP